MSKMESVFVPDEDGACSGIEVDCREGNRGESAQKVFLSVDEILVLYVGEFGRAQLAHFMMANLAWAAHAIHLMITIFGDRVPNWQCLPDVGTDGANVTCSPSSSLCDLQPDVWEWVGGKSASTVSQWNLICGDEYKAGLSGSLFFLGVLFGAGIYGNLSDSLLGRKGSLAVSCLTASMMGLLTSVAPSYWVYALLRFCTGLNCSGIGLCSFVLATEIIGPSKRGPVGMLAFYFFSVGLMSLPVFAYFSPSWRFLYGACAIPGFVYCVVVLPFLWESPRWYLVKGRVEEAMLVLRSFARRNGRVIPDNVYLRLDDGAGSKAEEVDEQWTPVQSSKKEFLQSDPSSALTNPLLNADSDRSAVIRVEDGIERKSVSKGARKAGGTLLDVFRYRETRWRMILMIFIWFFTAVVYYGLNLNVGNLGVNLYVSVFLNGLIEVPGFTITALLLQRLGRKKLLVINMSLAGCCCLVGGLAFVVYSPAAPLTLTFGPKSLRGKDFSDLGMNSAIPFLREDSSSSRTELNAGVVSFLFSLLGLFGMGGAYNLIYVYTMELFPTVVRNAALGMCSQTAGIGAVTAPLVAVLGHSSPSSPFLIFGVFALTGAFLGSRLPETLNSNLQETLAEMQSKDDTVAHVPSLIQGDSGA